MTGSVDPDGIRATVLHHAQLTVTLCREIDVASAMNSRRSSSTVDRTCRARLPLSPGAVNTRPTAVAVYIALANGRRAAAEFSKSRFWDKVPAGSTPLFLEIAQFCKNTV